MGVRQSEPFRAIASLEIFATLMSIIAFGDAWPTGAAGGIVLQGITDNLGNTFALTRLMTSKFPLIVILAELAAQLRFRGMELNLGWVPRDQNEEADALANEEFGAFDASRRVKVDPAEVQWRVLPRMLEVARDLHERILMVKASGGPQEAAGPEASKGHRARKGLKQRDPW